MNPFSPQLAAERNQRNPHPTKKGPGRRHAEVAHGGNMPKPKGAGPGFVLRTNPAKRARHDAIEAAGGIRQFKRQQRLASAK